MSLPNLPATFLSLMSQSRVENDTNVTGGWDYSVHDLTPPDLTPQSARPITSHNWGFHHSMSIYGKFSHLDSDGKARMVSVSSKPITARVARAHGKVHIGEKAARVVIPDHVLVAAEYAARNGARHTAHLVPLCHLLPIDDVELVVVQNDKSIDIDVRVTATWRTGVEIEALCGALLAGLTFVAYYKDMDIDASMHEFAIAEKRGGRSDAWGTAVDIETLPQ